MFIKTPFAPGCSQFYSLRSLIGAIGLSLLGGLTATQAAADDPTRAHSYTIDVPVVKSTPVVETRTVERPERVCEPAHWSAGRSSRYEDDGVGRGDYYSGSRYHDRDRSRYEERYEKRGGGVGAQILGGLIGGAIGNQFGGGNGRKALTIAGALVGSAIAREGGNSRRRSSDHYSDRDYAPDYVCRTTIKTRTVEDVIGYDVVYRYNNALHTKRMERAPGDTIELRVRAVPRPAGLSVSNTPSGGAAAFAIPISYSPATYQGQPANVAARLRRTL